MTQEKPKTLTPKLRFPEFRDAPVWESDLLGSFATIQKGRGVSKGDLAFEGNQPCIRYGELYTHYGEVIEEVISHTNVAADDLVLSIKQDVIIPASGETKIDIATASCVMLDGVALGSDLNIIRSHLYGPFFSYYLNGSKRFEVSKLSQGDTVAHLYPGQLEKIEISYPDLSEQKKVAACLASLDELIAAEDRKLAALRDHKRSLMQQLFPQPGKSQPRVRFPEFEDGPEWKVKKLREVFSIFQGFAFSSLDAVAEGTRWLKIANVSIQQMNHDNPSYLPAEFSEEYSRFVVTQDDFVMALTRPILGKQLKIARVDSVFDGALLNQRVGKLITSLNSTFVYYLLQTSHLISSISANIAGSEPPNLSSQQIDDIDTPIPGHAEKLAIADCLTALDAQITAQAEQIDSLKQHKRGLMQQLFPSDNVEVRSEKEGAR